MEFVCLLLFLSCSFTCLPCESELNETVLRLNVLVYRLCRRVETSPVNEDETGADHVL